MKDCNGVFVGTTSDCFWDEKEDWAVVHACKIPCHWHAVGYKGNLKQDHPNYLIYRNKSHLVLNVLDMNKLLDRFIRPIIEAFYEFMDEMEGRKVLIHCNQGQSRSTSFAILYLAKRKGVIPSDSYESAKKAFQKIYPDYNPGKGFDDYLKENWDSL